VKLTRWFLTWMRQILPSDAVVAGAVTTAMMIEGVYLFVLLLGGQPDSTAFAGMRLFTQVISMVSFAIFRVSTFHPVNSSSYRQWLCSTPWQPGRPLPMGPVAIVPQDLVVIAASMLLTRCLTINVLYVPIAYLATYHLALATVVGACGERLLAYLLGLALAATLAVINRAEIALSVCMATMLLGALGLHRSLRAYPWPGLAEIDLSQYGQTPSQKNEKRLGWPWDILSPSPTALDAHIASIDVIGVSLLVGAFYAAAMRQLSPEGRMVPLMLHLTAGSSIPSIVRISQYLKNHWAPISLFGRLRTRRPWQQRFDVIAIAPIVAFAISFCSVVAVFYLGGRMGRRGQNFEGIMVMLPPLGAMLSTMIILGAGPQLNRWKLAGRHRIGFEVNPAQNGLGQTGNHPDFQQTG
jgi:hypothetical protein